MAVAHDAASESHTGTTGHSGSASFNWQHTPVGTPRGVLVFVCQANNAGDDVTSVTYGSATLSAPPNANAADTNGEMGRVRVFFAGASIPTGQQTVTVNRANNANVMYAICITVTAGQDTQAVGPVLIQEQGTFAVQAVDDGNSNGINSLRYACAFSGGSNVLAAGSGSTVTGMPSIDFGLYTITSCVESAAGQGSRNVGFSYGTSDDRAAVHIAIREAQVNGVASIASTAAITSSGTVEAITNSNIRVPVRHKWRNVSTPLMRRR